MNSINNNGLTADNSQPAKTHSKASLNFTMKGKPLATYFIAANAVMTGVRGFFAKMQIRAIDVAFIVIVQICILKFWGAT